MSFFTGRKILVTGGTGMIGSFLVERLVKEGAKVRVTSHSPARLRNIESVIKKVDVVTADLTRGDDCQRAVGGQEFVFHLAAAFGGIGKTAGDRSGVFTPNILMNTQLLEAARIENVSRYLYTSTACVYPANSRVPTGEGEIFSGPPEPTNESYGWAKRMGEHQAQIYAQDFGMKIAIVRPFNSYGPRDNFDPETSHVIPALIRKAVAKQEPFMVWGDGTPSRDFVYADELARGMMLAIEKYPVADAVNLASGNEIKIRDLVKMILKICGHKPKEIMFERKHLKGQQRRKGDTKKAKKVMGFKTEVDLETGLKHTVDWYQKNKQWINSSADK